jgi:alanine racemase
VDCGESVSYGLAYTAEKKILEATISVGYGDGYPRSLSNCGKVLYNGVFLPIIGRVCMDMTMIDASGAPNLSEGDYVTLIGKSGDKKIEAEDLGFGYEILCKISPRVKRYII